MTIPTLPATIPCRLPLPVLNIRKTAAPKMIKALTTKENWLIIGAMAKVCITIFPTLVVTYPVATNLL